MVKVVFKDSYNEGYKTFEYSYQDYEGAAVGDVVVVNTRHGYAIAKITQVGVVDYSCDESELQTIVKTVISQKEIEQAQAEEARKQAEIKAITAKLRKAYLIDALGVGLDANDRLSLIQMSNEDLEKIYENLKSF